MSSDRSCQHGRRDDDDYDAVAADAVSASRLVSPVWPDPYERTAGHALGGIVRPLFSPLAVWQ